MSGGPAHAGADERPMPVRPALSPVLPGLAGAWSAVLAVEGSLLAARAGELWLGMRPTSVFALACAGACALLAVAGGVCARFRAALLIAVAGALAGSVGGALALHATFGQGEALAARAVSAYTFVVESDPQATATGSWRFEASPVANGGPAGRVWVEVDAAALSSHGGGPALPGMGAVVELVGRWAALDPADEFDGSLMGRGVAARIRAVRVDRVGWQEGAVGAVRSVRAGLLAAIDPYRDEARALLAGTVCGMQAALATFSVSEAFSELGLSHLVAVSGSHLAVVAALAGSLMGRTRARPFARAVVLVALLALYVVFTGFQASAVRSWVMASLALFATVAGRRGHAVSAVSVAAFALLLFDPASAQNMGFTLSVLSVLGLTVFAGLAVHWTQVLCPRRTPGFAVEALALTVVAQLFTLPVTLPAFGSVALLSPLANVVAGPLVSALLVIGLAAVPCAAVAGWVGEALLVACDVLGGAVCACAHAMAALPATTLAVEVAPAPLCAALAVGSLAVYARWPRPSRAAVGALLLCCGTVLAALCVAWRFFAPARMVVMDVGQGDAILVQDGRRAVLVDTGPDDAVVYALTRNRVLYLDAVVLTHTDADHAGGLDDVLGSIGVGSVVVAPGVADTLETDPALRACVEATRSRAAVELAAGDRLEVGGFALEALWPQAPVTGDQNADSLVLWLAYGQGGVRFTALLTGDAEAPQLEPLASQGLLGAVDVLKVGHHGSADAVSAALLEALSPTLAVASAGLGNRYGHPTEECVVLLEEAGTVFYCTAQTGDVELRPAEGGVRVHVGRASRGGGLSVWRSRAVARCRARRCRLR